jgi:hypothetical protein
LHDERERRKNLTKYIPDVSRALFSVLSAMATPAQEDASTGAGDVAASGRKRGVEHEALLEQVRDKRLKESDLSDKVTAVPPTCMLGCFIIYGVCALRVDRAASAARRAIRCHGCLGASNSDWRTKTARRCFPQPIQ